MGGTSDFGSFRTSEPPTRDMRTRVHTTTPTDREALLYDTYPMSQGARELMRRDSFESGFKAGQSSRNDEVITLRRRARFSMLLSLVAITMSLFSYREASRVVAYYPAGSTQTQIDSLRDTRAGRVKWYQWVDMEPNDQH